MKKQTHDRTPEQRRSSTIALSDELRALTARTECSSHVHAAIHLVSGRRGVVIIQLSRDLQLETSTRPLPCAPHVYAFVNPLGIGSFELALDDRDRQFKRMDLQ
mmetsp:Transcript_4544/g.10176  ORF Transcript_4544/g.10176 Transcript_4544/m.10176 type:complete len:104 (-) Transcript_4544:707-1018(-)